MKAQVRYFLPRLLLSALLVGTACSHTTAGAQPSSPAAESPGQTRAATAPKSAPQPKDEAQQQAEAFWAQRTVPCGDQTYMGFAEGEVYAMKGFRISVQTDPISEADKLNGLQWQGRTGIAAIASRTFRNTTAWQQWQNGLGLGAFNVEMTKRSGSWSLRPSSYSAVGKAKKLSCADIPPDVIERGSVWEQRMLQATKCANFMAIVEYMPLADVKKWTDGGVPLNINSCRKESDGTTPLMKAALMWDSNVTEFFLQRGADTTAVDNSGRTALQLVEAKLPGAAASNHGEEWKAVFQILRNYKTKQ